MNAPESNQSLQLLSALLDSKGLDAGDLIDAINVISEVKKKDAELALKEVEKAKPKETKFFKDKEFVYENRTDVFIYRNGNTKSGRYYVRIKDESRKTPFVQSLRTSNRHEALVRAEQFYRENKNAISRGVKVNGINTKELIRLYLNERREVITNIPHQGITHRSFATLEKHLKYWQSYIDSLGYKNRVLGELPPEIGKRFGTWILELPKTCYTDTPRSNETVNHTIAAVKKMYRDVAIDEKYITMAEFPIFRYLKVPRDAKPKRDILEREEFTELRNWMRDKWCREKGIDELERVKRYVYGLYLTIQYYGGFRNKEILGIRWGDIKTIKKSDPYEMRVNRSIHIPAWNSKTGVSRDAVAPVGIQFERIKEHYKKLGITDFGKDDFVFINLAKTKRGKNIPYEQPAMEKRLKAVVEGSGLKKKLDDTGRHITQYSARHFAVVDALMREVSVYDIAINLGTSVNYIEKTYAKQLTAMMKQKQITKGQGYWKIFEEKENISTADSDDFYNLVSDFWENTWEETKTELEVIRKKAKKGDSLDDDEIFTADWHWMMSVMRNYDRKNDKTYKQNLLERIERKEKLTSEEYKVMKVLVEMRKRSTKNKSSV